MSENKIDIKNHPIVIIALAVAGSLGFYHQVILPKKKITHILFRSDWDIEKKSFTRNIRK